MLTDTVKLINPLVFLDIASTELDLRHARIVRISTIKINLDGTRKFVTHLIDPTVEISESASQLHGITSEHVRGKHTFAKYAESIVKHLSGCDLVGFGIKRYALPLLRKEFRKSKVFFTIKNRSIIDLMNIYHKVEPRDYKSAYKRFVGKYLHNYYDSRKRVQGMIEILNGQLEQFEEIPKDMNEIIKWLRK